MPKRQKQFIINVLAKIVSFAVVILMFYDLLASISCIENDLYYKSIIYLFRCFVEFVLIIADKVN